MMLRLQTTYSDYKHRFVEFVHCCKLGARFCTLPSQIVVTSLRVTLKPPTNFFFISNSTVLIHSACSRGSISGVSSTSGLCFGGPRGLGGMVLSLLETNKVYDRIVQKLEDYYRM